MTHRWVHCQLLQSPWLLHPPSLQPQEQHKHPHHSTSTVAPAPHGTSTTQRQHHTLSSLQQPTGKLFTTWLHDDSTNFPVPTVWRMLTSVIFHGGLLHVAFNMLAFLPMGMSLERITGTVQVGEGQGSAIAKKRIRPCFGCTGHECKHH